MSVAIKVPSVGESITEGNISRWLKKDGDTVQVEEPIFELETEKATSPVPAPASGVLRISVPEGQTVAIGAVVGQIEPAAAGAASPPKPAPKPQAHVNEKPAAASPALSPAARRIVAEEGIDARTIPGSGKGGRVTKEDVVNAQEQRRTAPAAAPPRPVEEPRSSTPAPPPPKPAAPAQRETRQRMSAIRQRIAERLLQSQKSTATLTTFNEADMSAVLNLRAKYRERFKEKHEVSLGFMPFFVKAAVAALKAYPQVNGRIEGAEIVLNNYYNIGVAVSTDKGLMVPVLPDADQMSFAQVDKAIAALAERARKGSIAVSDLQGGTFTITNGGIFGSMLSTPILNPPQSAILGMHSIQKRAVVVDDQVVVRPMMYLALSYDHRLIDGRDAVLFLVRIKECIEDPERLLLDV
jgi:2-oxoglutarate dehydrogenase E2 component (dihydrolipoamide succinyltransferase)